MFHFLLSSYPTLEVSPGSRDDINVQDSWRRCRNLRKGKCKSEEPHVLYSSVPPARMHFPHFNRLHKDHPETKPQTFPPRSKGRHQLRSLEESTLGFLQHMPGNISLNQTAAEKTRQNELVRAWGSLAADSHTGCPWWRDPDWVTTCGKLVKRGMGGLAVAFWLLQISGFELSSSRVRSQFC